VTVWKFVYCTNNRTVTTEYSIPLELLYPSRKGVTGGGGHDRGRWVGTHEGHGLVWAWLWKSPWLQLELGSLFLLF